MSEAMDEAVINMPYELAMESELSRKQFYDRANSALSELIELRAYKEAMEIPDWVPCREACDPDSNGARSKHCNCPQAKQALDLAYLRSLSNSDEIIRLRSDLEDHQKLLNLSGRVNLKLMNELLTKPRYKRADDLSLGDTILHELNEVFIESIENVGGYVRINESETLSPPEAQMKMAYPEPAKPVPADKPLRITEQDAREIAESVVGYVGRGNVDYWFRDFGGRELLNKLNADREQVPAVAKAIELLKVAERLFRSLNHDPDRELQSKECRRVIADLEIIAPPSHSQQSAE